METSSTPTPTTSPSPTTVEETPTTVEESPITGEETPTTVEELAAVTEPNLTELPTVSETPLDAPEQVPLTEAVAADPVIAAFLEGDEAKRDRLAPLLANPSLPAFSLTEWHNSEALDWAQLEGKLVLLDFWATWCGSVYSRDSSYQRSGPAIQR